jgi:acetylxylan esterase
MRPLSVPALRLSLACALVPALAPSLAWAGSWQANISYGGGMSADLFVPDSPADPAALVISLHYCSGQKTNARSWVESYADTLGFYIITPQAGGNCFDATAAKGGERGEIVEMVEWAIAEHGVDPKRVFAVGASSGACMTQALLAAYPDVFAAGSSLAGVPAGAWTGGNNYAWSTPNQSAEQWGNVVRNLNPDYTGPWPRVQIWHGQGDDTLTYPQNWPAQTGQWTNVWGFTDADATSEMIQPPGAQDTWDRKSYVSGGVLGVETNSGSQSVPHDVSGRGVWGDVVRFLGPDVVPPDTGSGGTNGSGGSGSGVGGASGSGGGGGSTGGASTGGASTGGAGMSGGTSAGGAGAGGIVGSGGALPGSSGAGGALTSSGGTPTDSGAAAGGGCSFGGVAQSPTHWMWGSLLLVFGLMLGRRRQQS